MNYQIFNEDCLIGMSKISDNAVDAIICDLPYNVTDCVWDKSTIDLAAIWKQFRRILKPCCSAVLFSSGKFTHKLIASNFEEYKYKWIWVKNVPTGFVHAKNMPMHKYEEILVFSDGSINHATCTRRRMKYNPQGLVLCSELCKNGVHNTYGDRPSRSPWIHNTDKVSKIALQGGKLKGNVRVTGTQIRSPIKSNLGKFGDVVGTRPSHGEWYIQEQTGYPSDVIYYNVPHNVGRLHPTQKPVDLLEYLIKTYTNEGETVLDATMGSGSTGVACVNTNRNFIGFELEEKFFEISKRRIDEAIAKRAQSLF